MRTLILAALAAAISGPVTSAEPNLQTFLSNAFGPQENVRCGIPPIPPPGCRVGACSCDSNGDNCQWTIICS